MLKTGSQMNWRRTLTCRDYSRIRTGSDDNDDDDDHDDSDDNAGANGRDETEIAVGARPAEVLLRVDAANSFNNLSRCGML